MNVIPVSAVVPTRDRPGALARTLESLAAQGFLPAELVVIDGSTGPESKEVVEAWCAKVLPRGNSFPSSPHDEEAGSRPRSGTSQELATSPQFSPPFDGGAGVVAAPPCCVVRWLPAEQLGAAIQRNQGVTASAQPFVWFFDDDILFEPECVNRLWTAMQSDSRLGGVNAMIVNQRYHPPGAPSRIMFTLMNGRHSKSFAGRVLGPAVNLAPEDREDLPEVVPVEWLNTGCTLYRREALPSPPFDSVFTGYSLMEDVALSLRVGRKWRLANARTARIFHDSQPGAHKDDVSTLAKMETVNRHYVMTEILGRKRRVDFFRLFLWEVFQLAVSAARAQSRPAFPAMWRGKWQAIRQLRTAQSTRAE